MGRGTRCGFCGGTGEVDSGGFTPWGTPIDVACPYCKPDPRETMRSFLLGRVNALQDTIDYAAPEIAPHYQKMRDRLLERVDRLTDELKREGIL